MGRRKKGWKTDEQYLEAIEKSDGVMSTVAEILGITRNSVYAKFKNNPHLKEAYDAKQEAVVDVAESELLKLIKAGDFQAIKFFLSSSAKGRERGYGDTLQINTKVEKTTNWNLQVLGVDELLRLEETATRLISSLPEGEKRLNDKENTIEGVIIQETANA